MSSVGYSYMSAAFVSLISVSHLSLVSASTPEWCKYCLEDVMRSDRCLDYKTRLNWCVSGYPGTMREQCSRTCGYCDGCPSGTAEANQHAKDSAPTKQPTPFTGTGPNCKPDRKFTGDTEFRTGCGDWRKLGYCETHQWLMHRDCADTCGLCTHPEGARAQQPAPRPVPAPQPSPVPAPRPDSGRQERNVGSSSGSGGGCTCDRYGSDGAACNAAVGCEWSWDVSKCIPIEGTCEAIRSDGSTCTATPGCEWDWEHNCCVTGEDTVESGNPCQRIGSNGLECSKSNGCQWDWDRSICVTSDTNDSRGATSVNGVKTGKNRTQKGGRSGKRGGKLGKGSKSSGGIGATNPCAKLKGKRCTKNASCHLDGKVCVRNGGSGVACERLSRKLCKGSCRFDKASRRCIAL